MDGAIIPLTPLNNRAQKRKFVKEATKIAGKLEEINQSFIYHLFNSEGFTYREIYIYFLDQWNAAVNLLVKTKKFSSVAIDVLFFEREYKPQLYFK